MGLHPKGALRIRRQTVSDGLVKCTDLGTRGEPVDALRLLAASEATLVNTAVTQVGRLLA